jgi:hypothetical protein
MSDPVERLRFGSIQQQLEAQAGEIERLELILQHSRNDNRDAGTLIAELEADNARLQARIDALMLEHCPDEMTAEQLAEWGNSQVPVIEEKK